MAKLRPKLNTYAVIMRAVEEGIRFGDARAYKHTDTPSRESVMEHMEHEIANALSEVVRWD